MFDYLEDERKCNVCGTSFGTERGFNLHMRLHELGRIDEEGRQTDEVKEESRRGRKAANRAKKKLLGRPKLFNLSREFKSLGYRALKGEGNQLWIRREKVKLLVTILEGVEA